MVCIYCAKTNFKKQSSINNGIVTYTRHTFEQPKKKYVHLLHYFCFFADYFQVCFGCKLLVAGLKLGNENGCKCNAHKEHKDPVDESARKAKKMENSNSKALFESGKCLLEAFFAGVCKNTSLNHHSNSCHPQHVYITSGSTLNHSFPQANSHNITSEY